MCQIIVPCPDMRIGHNLSTSVTIGVSHEHVGSRRSKTETSQSVLASSALQAGCPRSTCASGLYCNVYFHIIFWQMALAGVCCGTARCI